MQKETIASQGMYEPSIASNRSKSVKSQNLMSIKSFQTNFYTIQNSWQIFIKRLSEQFKSIIELGFEKISLNQSYHNCIIIIDSGYLGQFLCDLKARQIYIVSPNLTDSDEQTRSVSQNQLKLLFKKFYKQNDQIQSEYSLQNVCNYIKKQKQIGILPSNLISQIINKSKKFEIEGLLVLQSQIDPSILNNNNVTQYIGTLLNFKQRKGLTISVDLKFGKIEIDFQGTNDNDRSSKSQINFKTNQEFILEVSRQYNPQTNQIKKIIDQQNHYKAFYESAKILKPRLNIIESRNFQEFQTQKSDHSKHKTLKQVLNSQASIDSTNNFQDSKSRKSQHSLDKQLSKQTYSIIKDLQSRKNSKELSQFSHHNQLDSYINKNIHMNSQVQSIKGAETQSKYASPRSTMNLSTKSQIRGTFQNRDPFQKTYQHEDNVENLLKEFKNNSVFQQNGSIQGFSKQNRTKGNFSPDFDQKNATLENLKQKLSEFKTKGARKRFNLVGVLSQEREFDTQDSQRVEFIPKKQVITSRDDQSLTQLSLTQPIKLQKELPGLRLTAWQKRRNPLEGVQYTVPKMDEIEPEVIFKVSKRGSESFAREKIQGLNGKSTKMLSERLDKQKQSFKNLQKWAPPTKKDQLVEQLLENNQRTQSADKAQPQLPTKESEENEEQIIISEDDVRAKGYNHFMLQSQPEVFGFLQGGRLNTRNNSVLVVEQALLRHKAQLKKECDEIEKEKQQHDKEIQWSNQLYQTEKYLAKQQVFKYANELQDQINYKTQLSDSTSKLGIDTNIFKSFTEILHETQMSAKKQRLCQTLKNREQLLKQKDDNEASARKQQLDEEQRDRQKKEQIIKLDSEEKKAQQIRKLQAYKQNRLIWGQQNELMKMKKYIVNH